MEERYILWGGIFIGLLVLYWYLNRPRTTPLEQEINAIIKGEEHKVKGRHEE